MLTYLVSFIFIFVTVVFLGGLIYTIRVFRKLGADSEEEAARKNWRDYLAHYYPFNAPRNP